MNIKSILSFVLLAGVCASLRAATNVTSIIPAPVSAEKRYGYFELQDGANVIADDTCRAEARLLAARLHKAGVSVNVKGPRTKCFDGDILFTTNGADASLGPEGYELTVSQTNVVIRAGTGAGIFYGVQSLLQLLPAEIFATAPVSEVNWYIPCVVIKDQPRFVWRGFHLDVSRHFFTKSEVEQVLDLMALYKLNTFHWHLVDDQGWRIQIKKYPKLTEVGAWRSSIGFGLSSNSTTAYDRHGRYGGFYTQKEIREVVAYAAARHITVVPEIEMPGHSSAALTAYPEYICRNVKVTMPDKGGVFTGVYCAGTNTTFQFLSNILTEVTQLFPGKYIHIGGDEVDKRNWKQCIDCQARITAEGLNDEKELQSWFIRQIEKMVNADGKCLIGWSEIREGGLAPSAALMDWIGGGAESAASGHDVVMTPTKYCYFDHYQSTNRAQEPKAIGGYLPLHQVYQFDPMPEKLAPEFRSHVLGGQANLWTEYIPNFRHVQYMMFPRLEALSEADWSPREIRDWNDFQRRVALNEKRLTAAEVNFRPISKGE